MKKLLILIAVATILGGISGKLLFSKYENIDKLVFNENKKVYLLQEGVYSSKSSLDSNTKDISPKLVVKNNDKYYVYVGITKNYNNAKKIKKCIMTKGIIFIKKKKI